MDMSKKDILEGLDPTTLAEASRILNQLGLPLEVALNMFLKQVILYKGLPFDVTLPDTEALEDGFSPIEDRTGPDGYRPSFDKEAFQRDISSTLEELKKSIKIPFGNLDDMK